MDALGLDLDEMATLLVGTPGETHLLVEVSPAGVDAWAARLGIPVRRCYFSDEHLETRAADGSDPVTARPTTTLENF